MTAPPVPQVWPVGKQTVGLNVELTPGAGGTPNFWLPVDHFNWNNKPTWLKDMAGRGVMAKDSANVIKGVEIGELDFDGPFYCDTSPFLVANLLGDVTATGTATTPTGTLSALSVVGATSVSSSVSIPSGTLIQIDVGNLAEIVTTSGAPTGAGPYSIPVPALAKPHANGVAITAVQSAGSFAHRMALMNSGAGRGQGANSCQPSTFAISQYYGPTATSGARQFVSVVITEFTLKWNAETELATYSAKAIAWAGTAMGSIPSPTYTAAKPLPSWAVQIGIGGPASGGTLVTSSETGEYNLHRAAKAYFTGQNSQNPYLIVRGDVSADWKSTFIAADEAQLNHMENNDQPQYQCTLSNGLTGANALALQVDMQQATFTEVKPNMGEEAVRFDVTGGTVLNSTNAGYTGGIAPMSMTFTNAVAAGSYS
jgi:hypothetical protein